MLRVLALLLSMMGQAWALTSLPVTSTINVTAPSTTLTIVGAPTSLTASSGSPTTISGTLAISNTGATLYTVTVGTAGAPVAGATTSQPGVLSCSACSNGSYQFVTGTQAEVNAVLPTLQFTGVGANDQIVITASDNNSTPPVIGGDIAPQVIIPVVP